MVVMLLLPLVMVTAGAFLLARGVRGRVVDDHPVCRGCGFDLFGRPEGVGRCSECGADLEAAGAVRVGNRRRRPGMVMGGVMMILPGVLVAGVLAWGAMNRVSWIEYAPHWYLLRQVDSLTAGVRGPAVAEYMRREMDGELSASRAGAVVELVLARQADRSVPWATAWGDLVEYLRPAGKVTDEQWRRYLSQAAEVTLSVRPEIRRGDRVVVRVNELPARCGRRTSLWARIRYEVQPDTELIAWRNSGSMGSTLTANGGGSMGHDYEIPKDRLATAADGPKLLHVKATLDLFASGSPDPEKGTAEARAEFDLRATWTLVPADKPTVRAIRDESYRAAVEGAITNVRLHVGGGMRGYVNLNVSMGRVPVPLAYRVVLLTADGREWPLTSVTHPAGVEMGRGTGGELKGFEAERVDVIFRPDEDVALGTVDITEYWGGEVVVKDVAVRRDGR